jgi:uncharacterized cofD-like protein
VALWEQLGDQVEALDWVGRLLGAEGRVLPMSAVPLEIEASVRGADAGRPGATVLVRGQHALAKTPGEVLSVRLLPEDPPAVPEAVAAIDAADWVVFGPGSWYTSVLPHLMVPQLADALQATPARRLLVLNLVPQEGETDGYTAADHVNVFVRHAPKLRLDDILVDPASLRGPDEVAQLARVAEALGARVHVHEVGDPAGQPRHDSVALAEAFQTLFERARTGGAASGGRS